MNCTQIDCTVDAVLLVRSDGATDDGVMMVLAVRSAWGQVGGRNPDGRGLYCEPHARELLARLPSLVLALGGAVGGTTGPGEVFTHG